MGKYLDALNGKNPQTPNQAPEITGKLENSVFSGGYPKHHENPKRLDTTVQPTGDQVDAGEQQAIALVADIQAGRTPRKWLQRLTLNNPETRILRPKFTELSANETSETRRQVPEKTEKSNNSVFSGAYLSVSENLHPAPTPLPTLTAQQFLEQVTQGLKVGVAELLRLGIITQQDIADLENGVYGPEHIGAYRALVEQQLTLKLAPGGNKP